MKANRFDQITRRFGGLRVAVLGDFCLDRYLEIDPARRERSLETGLPVHNVVRIRAQPGAAGTVLNNLAALGIGQLFPIGFCGSDGEGMELQRALQRLPGVSLEGFICTDKRQTFTYTKPLIVGQGRSPRELNRLDLKNWSPTPPALRRDLVARLRAVGDKLDALIVLDQVDVPNTGVVTAQTLDAIACLGRKRPELFIIADSRRGLRGFPPLVFKMNASELARLCGAESARRYPEKTARAVARRNRQPVFVTLSRRGIIGALPNGESAHLTALPVRGAVDVVGAGDAVTANITAAMVSGASLSETLTLANAAASVVVHKLGTTGTASVREIRKLML